MTMTDAIDTAPADLPADSSPPDELDALLSEYETRTAAREAVSNGHAGNGDIVDGEGKTLEDLISDVELSERVQAARDYRASLKLDEKLHAVAAHEYQTALHEAVANVRGDLDQKFLDDKLVLSWLDLQVREDEGLRNAWLNRQSDSRTWKAAEHILAKQFRSKYSQMPDPNLTEDREAVSAAVRGASVSAQSEPPPNYSRMSDRDFRDEMRKLGIQPNV